MCLGGIFKYDNYSLNTLDGLDLEGRTMINRRMSSSEGQKALKVKVLFVCMVNICRSPSAEAVFHHMVETSGLKAYVEVASAGTHDYHVGQPADERSHRTALTRGIDMSVHRAQHLQ